VEDTVTRRTQTWIALAVGTAGLIPAAILGLFAFMSATATPLHPSAADVPSVRRDAPPPRWADAVERARQIVRAGISAQNLPGMSVAVGVDRDIVWAEGFGWADLEARVPVAPDTRFRIGTASTALTSAAAGLLLERGRLKLDDQIQMYVPEYPKQQWPVTLRQLMAHTAGVRNDGGDEGPLFGVRCERAADALPYFMARPLLFEPGTSYRYSRYGWILVSAAIENAANEPLVPFMRREIFRPLGMDHTEADSAADPAPDRATPYFPRFAANPRYGPDPMREVDYSCYAGSSVFLSTPSDLVRFGLAITSGKLLQPATVRLLQASQKLPSGEETGYGLGWDLETVALAGKQTTAVGHDGDSLGGMVASLMTFPEHGMVVAVTSNISYADTFGLGLKIVQAFADDPASGARR
jgi:serine beta-lactamase-like protein LACTB, mitochondrial